jgi:hypothetical protein
MTMKRMLIFLTLTGLLGGLFFFPACDSGGDGDGFVADVEELLGLWVANAADFDMWITLATAQDAIDLMSEGTGGIALTGDVVDNLTWLYGFQDFLGKILLVLNQNPVDLIFGLAGIEKDFPGWALMAMDLIVPISEDFPPQMLMLGGMIDETTVPGELGYIGDTGDLANINYDLGTHTLTVVNIGFLDLINPQGGVLANGTLTHQTIAVPADIPTDILYLHDIPLAGMGDIEFNTDNTFTATLYVDDFGVTPVKAAEEEAIEGTWQVVSENTLRLTVEMEMDGETVTESIDLTYNVTDGTLTLSFEEDLETLMEEMDEEDIDAAMVMGMLELFLGLTPGSLDAVTLEATLILDSVALKGRAAQAVSPLVQKMEQSPYGKSLNKWFVKRIADIGMPIYKAARP